jgi:hypothetical protein
LQGEKEYWLVLNDLHIEHGSLQCHVARRKQFGGDLLAIASRQGSEALPLWTACLWYHEHSDSRCDQQETTGKPAAYAPATPQAAGSC